MRVIDFGTGDPREPTDPLIRQALVDGLRDRMGYPPAVGLPELREAIARGCRARFGVAARSGTRGDPDLGSKEAIFTLRPGDRRPGGARDTVVFTDPGYPVYERGALFAHARPVALPLREENGFLPDLDAIDERPGAARRLLGQLPEQPDRRGGAARVLRASWRRSRASTASCSPRTRPTRSSGSTSRRRRRSSSPTGRNVARLQHALEALLDDRVPERVRRRRPGAGRRAAGVPADGRHRAAGVRPARVGRRLGRRGARRADARACTRRKRALFLAVFERKGLRVAGSAATMYLWLAVPDGRELGGVRRAPARARRPRGARRRIWARPARATSAYRARPDRGASAPRRPRSWSASCESR